jgi:PAS domain S-box-containing protein
MKILVVEDDQTVAQTLKTLLSRDNYAVDFATDGEAGLRMADTFLYDLMVLDVVLPKLDGVSLCQQLRANGFQNPILLLMEQGAGQQTAIRQRRGYAKALHAGANACVTKPFDSEEFTAQIQSLLRQGSSPSQPILTWGNLALDPNRRTVTYDVFLLSITPKEYAILELFLRHPQEVLSTSAMLERAWSAIEAPSKATVRGHIKALRQKLKAAGAPEDLIQTVHQLGYQLNPLYSELNAIAHCVSGRPLSILQDMSEGKSAGAECQQTGTMLRDNEARLQRLAANIAAMMYQYVLYADGSEAFTYISPRCRDIYELEPEALQQDVGQVWAMIHPEDRERVRQANLNSAQRLERFDVEFRLLPPSGCLRWVRAVSQPERQANGDVVWDGLVLDITLEKSNEKALRENEHLLRLTLAAAQAGSWSWEVATGQITWSPEIFRLYGLDPDNGVPQYEDWCNTLVYPDDRTWVNEYITQAITQRQPNIQLEFRIVHPQRGIRWLLSLGCLTCNDQGEPVRFSGINLDISDRKQAEFTLQQQLSREQLIAEISQDIRRSLDLNTVLTRTVERIRELLNTDRVVIFRFHPDWQGDVIMESVGAEWLSLLSTTISDPCFRDRYIEPYRQGRISTRYDIEQEGLEPCYVELLQQFQVKANLIVPILPEEKLWGLLIAHQCSAPRQWQPTEIDLLRQLATQVGIAIQQSELYEQTRQELAERERMQTVLQESEERFRTLSATAPIGICQTNADGICLYTNAYWQEMSGLSFEDSLGNGWLQAVHPQDRQMLFTAWESYLQGEREHLPEFRLLTPQKVIRWVSAKVATLKSAIGEIIGYVSLHEDITERKQAEAALRDSEQRLQAILDHSPAVIYLLDLQNKHLLANCSYAELLSTTPEHLVGKSIYEVWPADIANTFADNNRHVLETGQLLQIEEVSPHSDGPHTYISVKFPLCDAAGTPYAVCGISTDITEKKQLEAQFYRAQRLESIGTLASGIAHDLNNVFTPILALSHLLQLKLQNLDARSQQMLEVLSGSAERGADLVKQILTFARGSEGKPVPLQIKPLLHEVAHVVQQTFPKSIAIRREILSRSLWLVSADPTHLHQVLMNLCVNARDAMPNGGILTLSAQNQFIDETNARMHMDAKVGNYVVITVTDTGIGIAPGLLDRVFDPFFTTKAPGEGTGLGLSTVLGIIRNHGGFLQVSSEVGQGTQFQVYLPAIAGTVPKIAKGEIVLQGNGQVILIVDDEIAVQQTNQALLANYNFATLVARDGLEAIHLYREHHQEIYAVLLDTMMPNMDGFTTIRHLRHINSQVKIIAISGIPSNQQLMLQAGANVFLSKPYTTQELLMAIQEL